MFNYLRANLNIPIFECRNVLFYGKDIEKFSNYLSESHVVNLSNADKNVSYDLIYISSDIEYVGDVSMILKDIKSYCDESTRIVLENKNHIYQIFNFSYKKGHWFSDDDIINFFLINNFSFIKSKKIINFSWMPDLIYKLFLRFIPTIPLLNALSNKTLLFFKINKNIIYKKYSVIIPTRNEMGNIYPLINRFSVNKMNYELIFIDGNSQDKTFEEINRVKEIYGNLDIKVHRQKSIGKGGAVREGVEYSTGDVIVILDADISVPPESIDHFCETLESCSGDFINGTRLVYSMEKCAMRYLNHIANKIFSIIFSWLFDQRYTDTLCGTKVISKKNFENIIKKRKLISTLDPFGDFDLLVGANLLHLKTIEVPIVYESRKYGQTNISRFRHGLILFKMVLEVYFKHKAK